MFKTWWARPKATPRRWLLLQVCVCVCPCVCFCHKKRMKLDFVLVVCCRQGVLQSNECISAASLLFRWIRNIFWPGICLSHLMLNLFIMALGKTACFFLAQLFCVLFRLMPRMSLHPKWPTWWEVSLTKSSSVCCLASKHLDLFGPRAARHSLGQFE